MSRHGEVSNEIKEIIDDAMGPARAFGASDSRRVLEPAYLNG